MGKKYLPDNTCYSIRHSLPFIWLILRLQRIHLQRSPSFVRRAGCHESGFFKHPQVAHAIPQQLASWYQSDAGQWMNKLLADELVGATLSPTKRYQAFQKMYPNL